MTYKSIINSKGVKMSWDPTEAIGCPYAALVWGLALALTAPSNEDARMCLRDIPHKNTFSTEEIEDAKEDALKLQEIYEPNGEKND